MEGADGETDFEIASKRCCNKHAPALGRGETKSCQENTLGGVPFLW